MLTTSVKPKESLTAPETEVQNGSSWQEWFLTKKAGMTMPEISFKLQPTWTLPTWNTVKLTAVSLIWEVSSRTRHMVEATIKEATMTSAARLFSATSVQTVAATASKIAAIS